MWIQTCKGDCKMLGTTDRELDCTAVSKDGGVDVEALVVSDESAQLLVEAGNAYEATGLTPSQLQARVAELEAALRTLTTAVNSIDYCYVNRPENFALALTCAKSDALTAEGLLA